MKIFILFAGLIAQVNLPWTLDNTAVLPDAPDHVAFMRIPYGSIADPDDWVKSYKQGNDVLIPLKGLVVQVKGTRGVFSGLKSEYVAASVPMHDLAPHCKLRDEVKMRKVVPGELAAYIDYRGGHMYPDTYLKKMLYFKVAGNGEWTKERCAVCQVHYEAELRGTEARLVITKTDWTTGKIMKEEIRVAGGTHILVSNRSASTDSHYGHLYKIYRSCSSCERPMPWAGKSCGQDPKLLCNLTSPDPGDDCTIIRHP